MVNTLNKIFLRFPWEFSVFFIEKTGKLQLTPLVEYIRIYGDSLSFEVRTPDKKRFIVMDWKFMNVFQFLKYLIIIYLVFVWQLSIVNVLSEFVNMEKIGHCYLIQYSHLKSLSPTSIKAELDSTLGKSAPLFTTIKYWVTKFEWVRTSCQGEHRNRQPNDVTTTGMVKKIHKMLLDDRRIKVRELADMVDIPKSAVHRILTENFEIRNL